MAVTCAACAAENAAGKKFCTQCGQPLATGCPSCGAAIDPGSRFCGDCGAPLGADEPAAGLSAAQPSQLAARVAERRLTSVLFGDLVGFTTISESRDAEDVREVLSEYFAMASTVVGRYGGTIEKFIGDAVMAVWGAPVAHEDDAERAVRAGLDLVGEIKVLAERIGIAELDMRVGILTGEVAVTIGAVGEGMVAGDAVNTAARIQSAAAPGEVWVDETTRSLTSAAVTYTDAGEHALKGKSGPVRLFRAGSVVASVGGAQRVDGLEAPFAGRDHELRLVKELFHAAIDEGRSRLVVVSGPAGVGKTRLAWELEKYVDGLTAVVLWHRSRVLSYGDGVTFWPLAEMVRVRLGLTDGDPTFQVEEALAASLQELIDDPSERDWLRPRIAALLGLGSTSFDRDDLFAAWVGFFDRIRDDNGVVLVFDDMQHAEGDLLDFLDHALEAARFPLFILCLARPELADVRPGWGTGRRATAVYLEPLAEPVMTDIVKGLVDGLPASACQALVERAEGIPLYALEMVRGLIDRDAVIPRGGRYVLADDAEQRVDLETLDAPASLQALIAARLDSLTPAERQLVQDATVHGMAFSRAGIQAVSDVDDLDAVLDELVRKEILEVHADRFSAERGQFRFVQSLVRTVAYETLSRRDRKTRHLAVAAHLATTSDGDELAAIIARHHLDAVDNGPDDADAGELLAAALAHLERAAQRAQALGSPREALRHFTTALERAADLGDRARLLEGAAGAAKSANRLDDATEHAAAARTAYEALDDVVGAGRAVAVLGSILYAQGQVTAAVELVAPVYEELEHTTGADEAILALAETLVSALQQGDIDPVRAEAYTQRAMQLAEGRQDWTRVANLLTSRALAWFQSGQPTGGVALLRASAEIARREHLPRSLVRALLNLAAFLKNRDIDGGRAAGREAVVTAVQGGVIDLVGIAVANLALACWVSGDWDEIEALHSSHADEVGKNDLDRMVLESVVALVRNARHHALGFEPAAVDIDAGDRMYDYVRALWDASVVRSRDDADQSARRYIDTVDAAHRTIGLEDDFAIVWPFGVEHALAAGLQDEAERLVAYVGGAPPGLVTPLVHAHHARLRALVAIGRADDDSGVDDDLAAATQAFRDLGVPYYLAKTLLERGRRRSDRGDDAGAAPLLEEAGSLCAALGVDVAAERSGAAAVG